MGSAQVSRYTLRAYATLSNGETLDDVLAVNGEPRVDRANKPTSRAGTSPFKGDYLGLTPAVSMVPKADGSGWRWAINPNDVPGRAFHGIFADNRNLVPPANPDDPALYQFYQPPFTSMCGAVNAGSRNTDVFVSQIDGDLVVSAPTTFMQLKNIQRTFPIVVSSGAAVDRYFKLSFVTGGGIASFLQESNDDDVVVLVHPYSSATRVVYVGDCSSGKCLAPTRHNRSPCSCRNCPILAQHRRR